MNRTAKIWLLLLTITTLVMVVALAMFYRSHLKSERERQVNPLFEPAK